MTITKLKVFKSPMGSFEISFHKGVNIFTGVNGTGKSTILRMLNMETIEGTSYQLEVADTKMTIDQVITSVNSQINGPYGPTPSKVIWDGEDWIIIDNKPSEDYNLEKGTILKHLTYADDGKSGFWYYEKSGYIYSSYGFQPLGEDEVLYMKSSGSLTKNYNAIITQNIRAIINEYFLEKRAADKQNKKQVLVEYEDDFQGTLNSKLTQISKDCIQTIKKLEVSSIPLDENCDTSNNAHDEVLFVDLYNNKVQIDKLSDGQKRSILSSFIFNGVSNIILLDEPDNFLSNGMINILSQKIKESNKQMFIVTHNPSFVYKLYNILPHVIVLRQYQDDIVNYLNLREIKNKKRGFFSISNNAQYVIEALFSNKVLIVEGTDEVKSLYSHKEIKDNLNAENISIWPAGGFDSALIAIEFCEGNDLEWIAFLDSDEPDKQIEDKNIHYLNKPNLEGYIKTELTDSFAKDKLQKKEIKKKIRTLYDEGKLIYTDEYYNELSNFLFGKDLEEESEFSWM